MNTEIRRNPAADMSTGALDKLAFTSPTPVNIARATVAHANELQRGCVHSKARGEHWTCEDCVKEYLVSLAKLLALRKPKRDKRDVPKQKEKPLQQGMAWTAQLDEILITSWNGSAQNNTLPGLALKLGRSETSIAARLVKLGLVSDRDEARTISAKRLQG